MLRAVALVLAVTLCGCGRLAFRQDNRIRVEAPADESTVSLPVTIRWSGTALPAGGSYGVFVDTSVPAPGMSLRSRFAGGDQKCRVVPTCPDAGYLAALNVFVTTGRSVVVPRVSHPGSKGAPRVHRATIVPLDDKGRRVGEASWSVTFTVAGAAS